MSSSVSRRRFLRSSALALAAAGAAPALGALPSTVPWRGAHKSQLNIGIVGVNGRGFDHVREIAPIPNANICALCDVDANGFAKAANVCPTAAQFTDFREMLDLPGLDAVVVATPDHTHAPIAAAALRAGKHVYCEKPLAHDVAESRALSQLARETGLVTQMGIQIHSLDNYRRVVELIESGAIGAIREVHIWNHRSIPPADPAVTPPPPGLNYDLWLGPVSERPYHPGLHPLGWRRWWAFGTGLLGDIFCHFADVAFWALKLEIPTRISAEGEPLHPEAYPDWLIAHYDFPARGSMPPVKLHWYDPPKVPPQHASWKLDPGVKEGVMFMGEDGMLFSHYGDHMLLPREKFKNFMPPKQTIPPSPGHQQEWVDACLKNDPKAATCGFAYGALLTEAALLGCVAFRSGKTLEWDAANMRIGNAPDAEQLLKTPYRAGWKL